MLLELPPHVEPKLCVKRFLRVHNPCAYTKGSATRKLIKAQAPSRGTHRGGRHRARHGTRGHHHPHRAERRGAGRGIGRGVGGLGTGATRNLKQGAGWLLEPRGYVLLAACRPSEYAYEFPFDGQNSSGAFTYWLLDALRQSAADLTYQRL